MTRWKIYYSDGSTFSDKDGDPFNAPGRGVQMIVHEHSEVGRHLLGREDNYWWSGSRWFGGDLFGLYDYLQEPGPKKVIFGRVIDNESFKRITQAALNDPEFPPKSAKLQGERY